MKLILKAILLLFFAALVGCGSATEVGNPTGDLPVMTTVKGTIDLDSITLEVDAALLTVVAEAADGTVVESEVGPDGAFSLELTLDKSYSMEVRTLNNEVIGPFSFEQDDHGNRANRIEITEEVDTIDMGQVRFENGVFYPEHEPRRQMGNGQTGSG